MKVTIVVLIVHISVYRWDFLWKCLEADGEHWWGSHVDGCVVVMHFVERGSFPWGSSQKIWVWRCHIHRKMLRTSHLSLKENFEQWLLHLTLGFFFPTSWIRLHWRQPKTELRSRDSPSLRVQSGLNYFFRCRWVQRLESPIKPFSSMTRSLTVSRVLVLLLVERL